MRIRVRFILLTAAAVLLSAIPATGGINETIQHSFEVTPGGELLLKSAMGSIDVSVGPSNRVEVDLHVETRTDDPGEFREMLQQWVMDFNQEGNRVTVEVRREGERRNWEHRNNHLRFSFEVRVPQLFDLDLNTAGGHISVADLEGHLEARTAGGHLRFGNIGGQVMGRTAGGNIHLESSTAKADLKTAGGKIEIGRVRGDVSAKTSGGSISVEEVYGSIDASTSGGSITARLSSQPESDCKLSTSGGHVTVTLAPGIALQVDAVTSHGRVISQVDMITESEDEKKTRLKGRIGSGGPRLVLRSSAGNIRLEPAT